jgi:hypothetical protein
MDEWLPIAMASFMSHLGRRCILRRCNRGSRSRHQLQRPEETDGDIASTESCQHVDMQEECGRAILLDSFKNVFLQA